MPSKFDKDPVKKKRVMTAKQLANLRPVKKGEPGRNPLGAGAHNPAIRAFKKVTTESIAEVLNLVLMGTREDLERFLEDTQTTNAQVLATRAFQKAIKYGDYALLERMVERLVGKLPENINLNAHTQTVNVYDPKAIYEAIQKIKSDV